jgi:arylsulfatase A-like enzyme
VMLATNEWKIVVERSGDVYLLFDLRADPDERLNLAGDPEHATICDVLRKQLAGRTPVFGSAERS